LYSISLLQNSSDLPRQLIDNQQVLDQGEDGKCCFALMCFSELINERSWTLHG